MLSFANPRNRGRHAWLVLALLLWLPACASSQDAALAPDPLEPFNRAMLGVNRGLEVVVVRPVGSVYRSLTPAPARRAISNVAANVFTPVSALNALLQGKPSQAGRSILRFLVNSTLGLGGLIDVASRHGLPAQREDFGQTLAVWGLGNGPYLVLPLIGPTTLRDGIGLGVDTVTDPLFWILDGPVENYSYYGGALLVAYDDHRDDLDALRRGSLDFYVALRSAYLQSRRDAVHDGAAAAAEGPADILDSVPAD